MRALAVLLLAGCNEIYGLDATTARDAATAGAPNRCDPPYVVAGDHDGDGRPNASDPCPLLADPASNADDDLDGIGNACDPFPESAGDCIVMFEDFLATDPACWGLDPWGRGCADGSANPCSPLDADSILQFDRLLSMATVQVAGEILEVTDPMLGGGVYVYLQLDEIQPTITGHFCAVVPDLAIPDTPIMRLAMNTQVGGGSLTNYKLLLPPLPYGPARVAIGWSPVETLYVCSTSATTITTTNDTASAILADGSFTAGGRFALRADHVRFRADLIVGYGRGRQCTAQ